jgi:hypothetical protein
MSREAILAETRPAGRRNAACLLLAYAPPTRSISVNRTQARATMADFTKEWIEHLKGQIAGRMSIVEDKMDPQTYDQLVTDLAWFTFRFARDPDTKMRKIFR